MNEKEMITHLASKGYVVTKHKKKGDKLGHFEQAILSLIVLSIFFTIIAVIFTFCGDNADWPFYAADSTLSCLLTLITVRVIQKDKKGNVSIG